MTLSIRPAIVTDAPALWVLMDDHKNDFLDDFEFVSREWLMGIIQNGLVVSVVNENDYPVGGLWYDDIRAKTSLKVHILMDPAVFRKASKEGVFKALIDYSFSEMGVKVLFAEAMETQVSTIRWLEYIGFQPLIPCFRCKSRKNGKLIDCYAFQLTEARWKRIKHDPGFKPKRILKLRTKKQHDKRFESTSVFPIWKPIPSIQPTK